MINYSGIRIMDLPDNVVNVKRSFKYINLAILQFICMLSFNSVNGEYLAVVFSMLFTIITSIFLVKDILASPKNTDIVAFYIFIAIVFTFVACCLIFIAFTNLHYSFTVKGSPILFTQEARREFNRFKIAYIFELLFTAWVAIIFFMAFKDKDTYTPYFYSKFTRDNFLPELGWFLFKTVPVIMMLICACLIVFSANNVSKMNGNQLYIPEESSPQIDYNKRGETQKGWFADIKWFFNNLSLNYLTNYKYELHL